MSQRFYVVDALRGFAIISIMLLHNVEHFDFFYTPQNLPPWMVTSDRIIWDTLFFLFGGKSFAIFALLFGLTYFIQTNNQKKRGIDFRGRFAWRMVLLLVFGTINTALFQGDILSIYAVIGLLLIPLTNMNDKWLITLAVILLIQPLELVQLIKAIQQPNMAIEYPQSWQFFGQREYLSNGTFGETLKGNSTIGKWAVILWNYENGRYFQILSLFIFGMLFGRWNLFHWTKENKRKWVRICIFSAILFIPLFFIAKNMENWIDSRAILYSFQQIWLPFSNLSFMMFLVSGFTLLYHNMSFHNALDKISPVGKMSLSNYVFQSIVGAIIYYGFGLGLYKYTGGTYSLLIGLALSIIFILACTWWDKRHKRGPLESIWHLATWVSSSKKKPTVQHT